MSSGKLTALIDLIKRKSLKIGSFTLASGAQSNYLIDLKTTALHPLGSVLMADALLERVHRLTRLIDVFGGMATGAIPIVSSMVTRSLSSQPTSGFYVRKTPKGHGSNLLIDGCLSPGMWAVLIEDVTTTGGSVLQAVKAVREFGAHVDTVISVVDRREGAAENLERNGVNLISLFTREDFDL